MEDSHKVFPSISLLVLVLLLALSSLFNLIDKTEGAATSYSYSSSLSSPYSPPSSASRLTGRLEAEANQVEQIARVLNSTKTNSSNFILSSSPTLSNDQAERKRTSNNQNENENQNPIPSQQQQQRHFFVAPNMGKKKKKKSTTTTEEVAGRGVGANVQQSTLPLFELILGAAAHVLWFIVFLYLWRAAYYNVKDPYATESPYGLPVTPVPQARGLEDSLSSFRQSLEKYVEL